MHSGDPLGSSSFAARRAATSSLPNFELPPPPLSAPNPKFPPFGSLNSASTGSGSVASVGNLLTPPNTYQDNLGSPSNGSAYHQKSNSFPSNNQYWSSHQQAQNGGYSYSQQGSGQWGSDRPYMNSGSMNSMMRDGAHSTNDYQLPPFSSTLPPSGAVSLPAMAAVSQQPIHSGLLHQQMSSSLNGAHQDPNSQPDNYPRLPPTPTYFNQAQPSPPTQQQQGFSFSSGNSPNPRSPLSSSHSSRMSPLGQNADMQNMHGSGQSPPAYQRQFSSFGLPQVQGPVMTNIHTPSHNMALVGGMRSNIMGYNSGQAAMQQMYGGMHSGHSGAMGGPQNEKPFKCDQCMQSFNRNHDLKRHKRIHLAVKPYPCGHCDKSFSRKDALKRHMLVKGCGKAQEATSSQHDRGSGSPDSQGGYDSSSSSPSLTDEQRMQARR